MGAQGGTAVPGEPEGQHAGGRDPGAVGGEPRVGQTGCEGPDEVGSGARDQRGDRDEGEAQPGQGGPDQGADRVTRDAPGTAGQRHAEGRDQRDRQPVLDEQRGGELRNRPGDQEGVRVASGAEQPRQRLVAHQTEQRAGDGQRRRDERGPGQEASGGRRRDRVGTLPGLGGGTRRGHGHRAVRFGPGGLRRHHGHRARASSAGSRTPSGDTSAGASPWPASAHHATSPMATAISTVAGPPMSP